MIYATFEAFYAEVKHHLPQATIAQVEHWDYPSLHRWDDEGVAACVAALQHGICAEMTSAVYIVHNKQEKI